MTDEELDRLEKLRGGASGNASDEWRITKFDGEVIGLFADDGVEVCALKRVNPNRLADAEFIAEASHSFRDLINEIRRLKGLVKNAEWSGDSFPSGGCKACPWCGATDPAPKGGVVVHAADCPAFTPDGAVR